MTLQDVLSTLGFIGILALINCWCVRSHFRAWEKQCGAMRRSAMEAEIKDNA